MTTSQQPSGYPRITPPQVEWGPPPRKRRMFKAFFVVVLISLLAGGVGGFLLGRENPSNDAIRARIAEKMAEALEETPFGGTSGGTGTSATTGGETETVEATPVTVGQPNPVNFGGTEDSLSFTVTGATRQSNCPGARGGMLVLRVDVATGSVFNQNDMPFSRYSYVDTAGVTHTSVSPTAGGEKGYDSDAPASCSDGLPYGQEMKPNSRYTGSVLLDLPADAKTLTFNAGGYAPQKEWTLEIPRS